jgi:hypothetical protein
MVSTEYLYIICAAAAKNNVVKCQILCYNDVIQLLNIKKDTNLKRATRSLLEELNSISDKKHGEAIIEARATHVIDSAINLLNLIKENFNPEEAYELERRMINSIKGGDSSKFVRSIRRLRDNKETARGLKIIDGDLKDDN